jgi:hypothetical protein
VEQQIRRIPNKILKTYKIKALMCPTKSIKLVDFVILYEPTIIEGNERKFFLCYLGWIREGWLLLQAHATFSLFLRS